MGSSAHFSDILLSRMSRWDGVTRTRSTQTTMQPKAATWTLVAMRVKYQKNMSADLYGPLDEEHPSLLLLDVMAPIATALSTSPK